MMTAEFLCGQSDHIARFHLVGVEVEVWRFLVPPYEAAEWGNCARGLPGMVRVLLSSLVTLKMARKTAPRQVWRVDIANDGHHDVGQ